VSTLSQKSATVAEFSDSRTFLRQCGQGFTNNRKQLFYADFIAMPTSQATKETADIVAKSASITNKKLNA